LYTARCQWCNWDNLYPCHCFKYLVYRPCGNGSQKFNTYNRPAYRQNRL
jgi:hypothetical protein